MKKHGIINKISSVLVLSLIFLSCEKENNSTEPNPDPELTIEIPSSQTDYSLLDNWVFHPDKTTILSNYNLDIAVINENLEIDNTISITNNSGTNTGIDVFFVHPTILTQNTSSTNIEIENQPSALITLTSIAQSALLSKYGRVFAPRYRQSTAGTYTQETDLELQANVVAISYSDIKEAFFDYLDNYNNGNKIIIAGHSQGSYLLAMLLRDAFDTDSSLRDRLITAALGGMPYAFAAENTYLGGWWENIPFCTQVNECGCVQNWLSFDESQTIPDISYGLPQFNPYLINSGLVFRSFEQNTDWFLQDFNYYGTQTQSLQYYITSDTGYNLGGQNNFIAFDDLYTVRLRRENALNVALSLEYTPNQNDNRPNDLADVMNASNFNTLGYHTKDYNIYLWALMQQIDMKISNCQ